MDDKETRRALDIFADQRSKFVEYDDQISELKRKMEEDQKKMETLVKSRKEVSNKFHGILQQFATFQVKMQDQHETKKRKKTDLNGDEKAPTTIQQRLNTLWKSPASGMANCLKAFKFDEQTNTFTCECELTKKIQIESVFTISEKQRLLTLTEKSKNVYDILFDEHTKDIVVQFIREHM